jgi:tetratricopeptide (TPR) repeat protein
MIITGAMQKRYFFFIAMLLFCSLLGCKSAPSSTINETPIERKTEKSEEKPLSLADEIRNLIELGTPPSLQRALDLLRNRDVAETELGRTLAAVAIAFYKSVYPALGIELPQIDAPSTSAYVKIIKEAEKGIYTPAPSSSKDFFELLLPFIALLNEKKTERLAAAIPDLDRAMVIHSKSVLPYYFKGIVLERTGQREQALSLYSKAYELSADCYPAAIAIARLLSIKQQNVDAINLLLELLSRYPENWAIKRELAILYYQTGNWSRAEPALAELLQKDPKDKEVLLLRAKVLIEQKKYLQAAPLLDAYGMMDNSNITYLYLRARLQAEGFRNRDAALTFLRSILRNSPSDIDATIYLARLLIESDRESEQKEGVAMLELLLRDIKTNTNEMQDSVLSTNVLELAVVVAIQQQNWSQALVYNNQLLEHRRSTTDLANAVVIQQGLKKYDQALLFARELYDRDPGNEQHTLMYVLALINAGKKEDARLIIDAKLASVSSSTLKSSYYYLRSKLKTDEESILNDLRSSLFEDPRNLDALIAMLEVYHRRKDERRAVYYLKQALSLSPDNPILQPYKKIYQNQLN